MQLSHGNAACVYEVICADLPVQLEKRMEALGMTAGTKVKILHRKKTGTMVILLRGTRFAVGQGIADNIEVKELNG